MSQQYKIKIHKMKNLSEFLNESMNTTPKQKEIVKEASDRYDAAREKYWETY